MKKTPYIVIGLYIGFFVALLGYALVTHTSSYILCNTLLQIITYSFFYGLILVIGIPIMKAMYKKSDS